MCPILWVDPLSLCRTFCQLWFVCMSGYTVWGTSCLLLFVIGQKQGLLLIWCHYNFACMHVSVCVWPELAFEQSHFPSTYHDIALWLCCVVGVCLCVCGWVDVCLSFTRSRGFLPMSHCRLYELSCTINFRCRETPASWPYHTHEHASTPTHTPYKIYFNVSKL